MVGELPQKKNKRGGVGWWMDQEGRWRSPEDWPGNEPPVDGWLRSESGAWCPPDELSGTDTSKNSSDEKNTLAGAASDDIIDLRDKSGKPSLFRSPKSNAPVPETAPAPDANGRSVKTLLIAGTTVAVAVAISIGVLLTQSGADALPEDPTPAEPEVVFAAETDEIRTERRIETAKNAPAAAQSELGELTNRVGNTTDDNSVFDETLWEAQPTDCLDVTELVLIERSTTPIEWADNLECVPAVGSWVDPYVDVEIDRTIDAEVKSLIPLEIVHLSGGDEWTPATRSLFVNDITHPATLVILSRGSGHNPRNQSPDQWRPSNENTWCAYAIDWIAVKHRWDLDVTPEERGALTEMLGTCSDPSSDGPHLTSMVIDPVELPVIERIEAN